VAATPSLGYAQRLAADRLTARALQRRGVEAVNWGIPVVNYDRMLQALIRAKGATNQIVYWSGLPDWKNQTLTPNPDVVCFMPFFNTKNVGPMVLEIPSADPARARGSVTGTVMDCWQAALEDVGPAGVDKGKGGKYLILPPDYTDEVPDNYIVLPSMTYQGYALLRSVLTSGSREDVDNAVAYGKQIKLYPLSDAEHPSATTFVDVIDRVFDATIPYDLRFFESLHRMIQIEPWLDRDKIEIDLLKSIGIEKDKPFMPGALVQDALTAAAREAHHWFNARLEAAFPPYYARRQWCLPAPPEFVETQATFFEKPGAYAVDGRGLAYSHAFSSIKHLGSDQFDLCAFRANDGAPFDGGTTYRLTVPPNVPVTQCWSAVIYDRDTHTFIRNVSHPGCSSQTPGLRENADDSVDIYFGPKAPTGNASNWIPTIASGQWEIAFRFYGPEKALFDKTWKLPDIETVRVP
jgi:hypothetical protein